MNKVKSLVIAGLIIALWVVFVVFAPKPVVEVITGLFAGAFIGSAAVKIGLWLANNG